MPSMREAIAVVLGSLSRSSACSGVTLLHSTTVPSSSTTVRFSRASIVMSVRTEPIDALVMDAVRRPTAASNVGSCAVIARPIGSTLSGLMPLTPMWPRISLMCFACCSHTDAETTVGSSAAICCHFTKRSHIARFTERGLSRASRSMDSSVAPESLNFMSRNSPTCSEVCSSWLAAFAASRSASRISVPSSTSEMPLPYRLASTAARSRDHGMYGAESSSRNRGSVFSIRMNESTVPVGDSSSVLKSASAWRSTSMFGLLTSFAR